MPESSNQHYSPWNPGIEPEIPAQFQELETIYDPAHVFTSLDEINQLVSDTGLAALELISFRPHRLVLHELIVRVTADIVVLEGEAEEDLGINFRAITQRIFEHYIQPSLEQIEHSYETLQKSIQTITVGELEAAMLKLSPVKPPPPTFWQRLTGTRPKPQAIAQTREEREFGLINEIKKRSLERSDETEAAVLHSLHKVLGAISRTRGFIGNDLDYLAPICARHATSYLAGKHIGARVAELVRTAIEQEGYALIPDAEKPVLISLKGASASGKSSLRPMMRMMLAQLGIKDHGYGTISPDIWRKLLLDYETLGESYKYAGRFTSHEISVIDSKLDRYIRAKAKKRHSIPHLVVDRFRFDSFASEKIARILHKTYVHHIDTMYMYFIVTPPEATVERGWARGQERGRFKAVEDYLGHCVEAYTGMPKLLFKWLANEKPRYFFEFLDNSVSKGTYPRLIARGTQRTLQIYQPASFIDIERFRRINIQASSPEQVAAAAEELQVAKNLGFLRQCIKRIEHIDFIEPDTETCYLSIQAGKYQITDEALFDQQSADQTMRDILLALAPDLLESRM